MASSSMEIDDVEAVPRYDPEVRNKEIAKILLITEKLLSTFGTAENRKDIAEGIVDLDFSDQLAGALFTVFTAMRKAQITDVNRRGDEHLDQKIEINKIPFEVKAIVKEANEALGGSTLDFIVATTLMNLMTSFKLSWNEVRTSCSKFQRRGQPPGKGLTDISALQLSNVHVPFLRGITYKPERRSGMIRNMGALALGVNLVYEKKMTNKLESAFNNSIFHIDGHEIMCKLLKDAKGPGDIGQLLKLLGDYLLVSGDRSQGRIHFPLLMFVTMVMKNPKVFENFNFSGRAAMKFYATAAKTLRFKKKSNGPINHIIQIVFHSMFETVTEDLGILGQITNQKEWITRAQADAVFRKASSAPVKEGPFVNLLYYSKLAAANMSKVSGTSNPMLINRIVFAGQRRRIYGKALKQYLDSGSRVSYMGTDVNSVCYALQQMKARALKDIETEKGQEGGTTKWFRLDEEGKEVESDLVFNETGDYFY